MPGVASQRRTSPGGRRARAYGTPTRPAATAWADSSIGAARWRLSAAARGAPTRRRSPDRPAPHRYRRPCPRPGTIPSPRPRLAASHLLRSCRHTLQRRRAHPPTATPLRRGTREPTTTTRRRRCRSTMRRNGLGRTDPRTTGMTTPKPMEPTPTHWRRCPLTTPNGRCQQWSSTRRSRSRRPLRRPTGSTRICPYLLSEDGTSRSSQPDERHRCTAQDPPATLPARVPGAVLPDRSPRPLRDVQGRRGRSHAGLRRRTASPPSRCGAPASAPRSDLGRSPSSRRVAAADPPESSGPNRQVLVALGPLARSPSSCSSSRSLLRRRRWWHTGRATSLRRDRRTAATTAPTRRSHHRRRSAGGAIATRHPGHPARRSSSATSSRPASGSSGSPRCSARLAWRSRRSTRARQGARAARDARDRATSSSCRSRRR